MKTTVYNHREEIKAIVFFMILSLALIVTVKAQELPSEPTLESFTASIIPADNSLVGVNYNNSENNDSQLAEELKTWMSSGSYWNSDQQDEPETLSQTMVDWMKSGAYWAENQDQATSLNQETIAENEDK